MEMEQLYSSYNIYFDELAVTSFYSNVYLLLSEDEFVFTLGIQQHFSKDTEAGVCEFPSLITVSEMLNYAKCIGCPV